MQTWEYGQVCCKPGRRLVGDGEGLQPLEHWLPRQTPDIRHCDQFNLHWPLCKPYAWIKTQKAHRLLCEESRVLISMERAWWIDVITLRTLRRDRIPSSRAPAQIQSYKYYEACNAEYDSKATFNVGKPTDQVPVTWWVHISCQGFSVSPRSSIWVPYPLLDLGLLPTYHTCSSLSAKASFSIFRVY